jgi:hypothetical protein
MGGVRAAHLRVSNNGGGAVPSPAPLPNQDGRRLSPSCTCLLRGASRGGAVPSPRPSLTRAVKLKGEFRMARAILPSLCLGKPLFQYLPKAALQRTLRGLYRIVSVGSFGSYGRDLEVIGLCEAIMQAPALYLLG